MRARPLSVRNDPPILGRERAARKTVDLLLPRGAKDSPAAPALREPIPRGPTFRLLQPPPTSEAEGGLRSLDRVLSGRRQIASTRCRPAGGVAARSLHRLPRSTPTGSYPRRCRRVGRSASGEPLPNHFAGRQFPRRVSTGSGIRNPAAGPRWHRPAPGTGGNRTPLCCARGAGGSRGPIAIESRGRRVHVDHPTVIVRDRLRSFAPTRRSGQIRGQGVPPDRAADGEAHVPRNPCALAQPVDHGLLVRSPPPPHSGDRLPAAPTDRPRDPFAVLSPIQSLDLPPSGSTAASCSCEMAVTIRPGRISLSNRFPSP